MEPPIGLLLGSFSSTKKGVNMKSRYFWGDYTELKHQLRRTQRLKWYTHGHTEFKVYFNALQCVCYADCEIHQFYLRLMLCTSGDCLEAFFHDCLPTCTWVEQKYTERNTTLKYFQHPFPVLLDLIHNAHVLNLILIWSIRGSGICPVFLFCFSAPWSCGE